MLLDWPIRKGLGPATTGTNKEIWKAFVLEDPTFVKQIDQCKNWRKDYPKLVEFAVRLHVGAGSKQNMLEMCRAGLQKAHELFIVRCGNRSETVQTPEQAMTEAVNNPNSTVLRTTTYVGSKPDPTGNYQFRLASPHPRRADDEPTIWLHGDAATLQLQTWETYGCLEPSAAKRAADVVNAPDVQPLVADKIFCMLGVTSEVGPALELLKIPGSHVIGIARGGPKLAKLIEFCKQESHVSTTLQVPENGADLLEEFPAVAEWILECASKDDICSAKQLVLCMTAYMDGEANVRATVAMDLIVDYILKRRSNVALSCLTSPATVYTIPKEAADHAQKLYPKLSVYSYLTLGKWFRPVDTWDSHSDPILLNGIVHLQGPNYCLAKTMQQWRCLVAHSEGIPVSAPHAPPTRTYSVTHNATAATALEGQAFIEPLVAFDVTTCSTLMTSILLAHLKNPPSNDIGHPMELFWDGSVHGGIWRCPVTIESIGAFTYLLGLIVPRKYPQASLAELHEHSYQV